MKVSGILQAFLYVLPAVFLILFTLTFLSVVRESIVGNEIYKNYNKLERNCGKFSSKTPDYVCSSEIDNLNISSFDKIVLKSEQYDVVFIWITIFIYILIMMHINGSSKTTNEYGNINTEKKYKDLGNFEEYENYKIF